MPVSKPPLTDIDTIQQAYRSEFDKLVDLANSLEARPTGAAFASQAQVDAGTSPNTMVAPNTLATHLNQIRFSAAQAFTGISDAGKAPRLTAAGLLDQSFWPLPYATQPEVDAAAAANKVVSPLTLAGTLNNKWLSQTTARVGSVDAGKAPRLNAQGFLDSSFNQQSGMVYVGPFNATISGGGSGVPRPVINGGVGWGAGDMLITQVGGSYNFVTGTAGSGTPTVPTDWVVYNGTTWSIIPSVLPNATNYLLRDGSNQMSGGLNFAMSGGIPSLAIDGAVIDGGTY